MNPKLDFESLKQGQGIRLDIGCSDHKMPNWIGMDIRDLQGVDIVHDVQNIPYPIPTDSCFQILMSHLWEHLEPKCRIDVMDELWRIMKPQGQLLISVPYYLSIGACQDPTHYTCPNENTFTYFDPDLPLYQIYKPKPWKLIKNDYQMTGNLEVILEARKELSPKPKNLEISLVDSVLARGSRPQL
jgi:SAM-dependent methyltransferase